MQASKVLGVHRYPLLLRVVNSIGGVTFALAWIVLLREILLQLAAGASTGGWASQRLFELSLGLAGAVIGVILWLNMMPDFTLRVDGIMLSYFVVFRMFIPWDAVIRVSPSILPHPGLLRVCFRSSSPVHVFLGLVYGASPTACFLLRPNIEGYQEAINEIRRHIAGDEDQTRP